MNKNNHSKIQSSKGFTVVELMIATIVFAVVMLMMTFGVMQISRLFYKGITTTRTQEAARSITDELSRAVQFSGGNPPSNTFSTSTRIGWFCINQYRYTYALNKVYSTGTPHNHVFIKDQPSGGCNASSGAFNGGNLNADFATMPVGTNPEELIRNNMRLGNLNPTGAGDGESIIVANGSLYEVNIRVISGDNSVLEAANPPQKCLSNRAGTQFCAVSNLKTVVQKRI